MLQLSVGGWSYQGGRETKEPAAPRTFCTDSQANPSRPRPPASVLHQSGDGNTWRRSTGCSERPIVDHPWCRTLIYNYLSRVQLLHYYCYGLSSCVCMSHTLDVTTGWAKYTGWPNKNRTFLRYHIFAATTDITIGFCWSVQKLKQKTTSENFVLNILCKVTGNGLRHTSLLDDDQPGLGWHCHRPVLKTTYPGHLWSRWTGHIEHRLN